MYTFIFPCGRIHMTSKLSSSPFLCVPLMAWRLSTLWRNHAHPLFPELSSTCRRGTLYALNTISPSAPSADALVTTFLPPVDWFDSSECFIRMIGIIQCLCICDWLISLNIMSSRFIRVIARVRIPFLVRAGCPYCARLCLQRTWLLLSLPTRGNEEHSACPPTWPGAAPSAHTKAPALVPTMGSKWKGK